MKIRQRVKKKSFPLTLIVFLPVFVVFFSSLAMLLIYAKDGLIVKSIISSFLTWISYSAIHYLLVGEPIDSAMDEKKLPSSDDEWVLFGIASFLFVGGMSLVATGLNAGRDLETFIGVGVVLTGYFIAHYDLGDDIV